jgi:hypothetical protein
LGAIGTTAATIAVGTDLTTTTASAGATTNAAAKPTTVTISRGNVIAAAAVVAAVIIAIIAFVLLRPSPHLSTASGTTTPPAAVVAAIPTAQAAESWAGVYKIHMLSRACAVPFFPNDWDAGVAQNGNSMTFINEHGSLNADGSFVASGPNYVWRGVFATDGGQSVIRDGDVTLTVAGTECHGTFTATKE